MKGILRKSLYCLMAFAMILMNTDLVVFAQASEPQTTYEIYPTVQDIAYEGTQYELADEVNLVVEKGIDVYTLDRITSVLAIKEIKWNVTSDIVAGKQNVLIGIHGSNGVADKYVSDQGINDNNHFTKYDAHMVSIKDGTIAVLGKDTDSAFYGITSLKHIFNQVEGRTIENVLIKDFAQIQNRGFIEGYYGSPWSNEDRADLMEYGGDYKLNQYMFAPKDDPYHNAKWRELYPEAELKEVAKLAEAGNKSKTRYVYTLHPYMSNPIRFDANYEADLKLITDKFTQLMDNGVRQFGILADDAGAATYENQVRLLEDLTTWLEEQKETHPELVTELFYCPEAYYYFDDGLSKLNLAPDSVNIASTGDGGIWGKITDSWVNRFMEVYTSEEKEGRKPFIWVNWPCSDNTKWGLIMGGMERFLVPGQNPDNIRGIVLNPMQQSEANKSALFAVADYAWNMWETDADAQKNWEASFSYMDHGTNVETDASNALRELSKHMMNSNTGIPESKDLAPKLNAFRQAYSSGGDYVPLAEELIDEFTLLKESAKTYKENPGTEKTRDQIIYWLDCWEDTTNAAINYLEATIEYANDRDPNVLWSKFSTGQAAYAQSKTHDFWYLNHYEYAKVGNQYIVPFIQFLEDDLAIKVGPMVDPNMQVVSFISNRTDSPIGDKENVFDGKDDTTIQFQTPAAVSKDDYIGVSYTKAITLNSVRFLMGGGKNHIETAKLQYLTDADGWVDLNDEIYRNEAINGAPKAEIVVTDLDIKNVKGVRLVATEDNTLDAWLTICSIDINKTNDQPIEAVRYPSTVSISENVGVYQGPLQNASDGNDDSLLWLMGPSQQNIPAEAWVQLTFEEEVQLGKLHFKQSGDVIVNAVIEAKTNGTDWTKIGSFEDGRELYDQNLSSRGIKATAIRIRNLENTSQWWKIYDFHVTEPVDEEYDPSTPYEYSVIKTPGWSIYAGEESSLYDGNDASTVHYNPTSSVKDVSIAGDYIGYDLGRLVMLDKVHFVNGNGDKDKWLKFKLEYSTDNKNWTTFKEYTGVDSGKDTIDENMGGVLARYVRMTNMEERRQWIKISEFTITEVQDVPTTTYLYTNVEESTVKTIHSNSEASLYMTTNPITLQPNEYVGIKLERLKDVVSLESDNDNANVTVETSANGIEWSTAKSGNIRYARLINHTDQAQSVKINTFKLTSNEIEPITLDDTTMGINPSWGVSEDTRNNGGAFDGDMNKEIHFADLPQEGLYITFNLGQVIDVNSLRIYVQDSYVNYIRDADILVSTDKENWTKAFSIGDGVENTGDGDINALNSNLYPNTDSNYPNKFYQGNDDLNVKARYIRILFTASNNQRAVWFNEIMINNGEYLREINDPTFAVDPIEERGFAPNNMNDGNLTSAYKPNTQGNTITEGSIVYRISDHTDIKKINIIQSAATISNAEVTYRTDNKEDGSANWKRMGYLNKSLNEYLIYDEHVFEICINWKDVAPMIQEIITVNDFELPNVQPLKEAYANYVTITPDTYTVSSFKALETALNEAKRVLELTSFTQELVDETLAALEAAHDGLAVRATEFTALEDAIEKAAALVEETYTPSTWANIAPALESAKEIASKRDDVTQAQVNTAATALDTAIKGLVEKGDPTALTELIASAKALEKADYTVSSWNDVTAAIEEAQKVVDNAEETSKEAFTAATAALQNVIDALVDLRPLQAAIKDAENTLGESAYTPESWAAYVAKLQEAKDILAKEDATKEEVATAVTAAQDAKDGLVEEIEQALIATLELVKKYDNTDAIYTVDSFTALTDAITEADTYLAGSARDMAVMKSLKEALVKAESELVTIKDLRDLVATVEEYEENDYTVNSWKEFSTAITNAETVLAKADATKEEVETAQSELQKAIDALINISELKEVLAQANTIDPAKYTPSSATAFTSAKEAAEKVIAKADATKEEVATVTADLQTAVEELAIKAEKTALRELVESAKAELKNEADFVPETFQAMKEALTKSEALLNDENATKANEDVCIKALQEALDGLVRITKAEDPETGVKIEAPENVIPTDTILIVDEAKDEASINIIEKQLGDIAEKQFTFDISLKDSNGNDVIVKDGKVKVTLPIPEGFDREKLALYYIHEDGREQLSYIIEGDFLIFETSHFSMYSIIERKDVPTDPVDPSVPVDPKPEVPQPSNPSVPNTVTPNGSDNQTMAGANTGDTTSFANVLVLAGISASALLVLERRRRRAK